MKNNHTPIWSKLGWLLLCIFGSVILFLTWVAYNDTKHNRKQLSEAQASHQETKDKIAVCEEVEKQFTSLREQNSDLTKKVKRLNAIMGSLDGFIVIDPDQILSYSPDGLAIDLNWRYIAYVPSGTYIFDLAVYESGEILDDLQSRPNDSIQFSLEGPTKFEIVCSGKGKPYDSLELTLNLPNAPNTEHRTIEFKRPFSVNGQGRYHNTRDGLPTYPNELDMNSDPIRAFKRGVTVGDNRLTFRSLYEDKTKGHLVFNAMLHCDAHYCFKAGDAIANPFTVGRALGSNVLPAGPTNGADQLFDLIKFDPELPSRVLIRDTFNKGMHQSARRGKFLKE